MSLRLVRNCVKSSSVSCHEVTNDRTVRGRVRWRWWDPLWERDNWITQFIFKFLLHFILLPIVLWVKFTQFSGRPCYCDMEWFRVKIKIDFLIDWILKCSTYLSSFIKEADSARVFIGRYLWSMRAGPRYIWSHCLHFCRYKTNRIHHVAEDQFSNRWQMRWKFGRSISDALVSLTGCVSFFFLFLFLQDIEVTCDLLLKTLMATRNLFV